MGMSVNYSKDRVSKRVENIEVRKRRTVTQEIMKVYTKDIPEELIEKAISAYIYDNSCTPAEAMQIRSSHYAQEHGGLETIVEDEGDKLHVELRIGGETYIEEFPMTYETVEAEMYPYGTVTFENVELIAASLHSDYPWTDEAIVTSYWAEPACDTLGGDGDSYDGFVLLKYAPPRGIYDKDKDEDTIDMVNTFRTVNLRNYMHAKEPNPWACASIAVLYENTPLARKVLEQSSRPESFSVTPPSELDIGVTR